MSSLPDRSRFVSSLLEAFGSLQLRRWDVFSFSSAFTKMIAECMSHFFFFSVDSHSSRSVCVSPPRLLSAVKPATNGNSLFRLCHCLSLLTARLTLPLLVFFFPPLALSGFGSFSVLASLTSSLVSGDCVALYNKMIRWCDISNTTVRHKRDCWFAVGTPAPLWGECSAQGPKDLNAHGTQRSRSYGRARPRADDGRTVGWKNWGRSAARKSGSGELQKIFRDTLAFMDEITQWTIEIVSGRCGRRRMCSFRRSTNRVSTDLSSRVWTKSSKTWNSFRKERLLPRAVDAGFACVAIIPQPISHASPEGCDGIENSYVLKTSTTKKWCLVKNFLLYSGPMDNISLIEIATSENNFSSVLGPVANFQQLKMNVRQQFFSGRKGATIQAQRAFNHVLSNFLFYDDCNRFPNVKIDCCRFFFWWKDP